MIRAAVTGLLLGVALIIAVIATGNTFGQRCSRMLPHDPAGATLCVDHLAHGDRP